MDSILVILAISLALASVLNIILTKFSVSHIIGYIITGVVISNLFEFNGGNNQHTLELIGEFGIVFLMFTIGLEMSFSRLHKMKDLIFFNGFMQLVGCAFCIFLLSFYVFSLDVISSIIIALAFSLSSTAIVLPYLKRSKDIVTPYGQKSVAILVFQDLAVIPILLLLGFLSNNELGLVDVVLKTAVYAVIIIIFMFTLGKKVIGWLLHFSTDAKMDELFLGSVFTIVIGASLLAHSLGFTYSLGAFIAGMIIAETKFHVKVEEDISSYKDLLLGAFFFSIGTKIDITSLVSDFHLIFFGVAVVFLMKALIIYFIIRRQSNKSDSLKAAIALCQIGEFSFAIFTLAINEFLISDELGNYLILVTVLSMFITPFIVNKIYKIASLFVVEYFEADNIHPVTTRNHTIVCGFAILGRIVATELEKKGESFIVISDNLQHVLLARKRGYEAYFGHMDNEEVLESLNVVHADAVIVTVNSTKNKQIICGAILDFYPAIRLVVKVNSLEEKTALAGLKISSFVHAQYETARLLIKHTKMHSSETKSGQSNVSPLKSVSAKPYLQLTTSASAEKVSGRKPRDSDK
ncbi:cation:proton antiporter [Psychrobium sp. 1_MG-2023]|uniref:cation:proton antiporter n=1 Tax=Psychrobium sp. 1_MG-2023 TaxID=3062624 RepID=UPI000C33EF0E|nr:cation:proton antiporter [Psychrobium sp. 1_MG-2023]MDP2561652.1 cation:proton antiporter [Psychrobium sp. 1_MG-2023]PKF55668.1 potassium transporter [Alteromonadales bacterium alter-6D02]